MRPDLAARLTMAGGFPLCHLYPSMPDQAGKGRRAWPRRRPSIVRARFPPAERRASSDSATSRLTADSRGILYPAVVACGYQGELLQLARVVGLG
jgi:hypothetical protein